MAIITADQEVADLKTSGRILAQALKEVVVAVRPGVTTGELNQVAAEGITRRGGKPAFSGYHGYPAVLCTSINSEVVHGIPDPKRMIQSGDVVGLDLGVIYNGIYTDHAVTIGVGPISDDAQRLIDDTQQSLTVGLQQVKAGARVGDVSAAIQTFLEARNYGVVRQLTGHGVGHALHEPPAIPNFGKPGMGPVLEAGMVVAVEPMVTLGDWTVETLQDGWTIVTADKSLAAHFEHTVRVTPTGYELITSDE